MFLAFQTIFGLTDRGIEEIADSLVVRIADCISLPVNQSAAAPAGLQSSWRTRPGTI